MQMGLALKGEIKKENLIEGWWYDPRQCSLCGRYRVIKYTLKTTRLVSGLGRTIQQKTEYLPVCAECGDQAHGHDPSGREC